MRGEGQNGGKRWGKRWGRGGRVELRVSRLTWAHTVEGVFERSRPKYANEPNPVVLLIINASWTVHFVFRWEEELPI